MDFGRRFTTLWEFILTHAEYVSSEPMDVRSGGRGRRDTYHTREAQAYHVEMFDNVPQRIIKPNGKEVIAGE